MSKEKTIELKEGDFTTTGLVSHLNERHVKANGEKFSTNDVQQYLRRKKLPQYVGGHPLEEIVYEKVGLRIIRVDFSTKAQRKKAKTTNDEE